MHDQSLAVKLTVASALS